VGLHTLPPSRAEANERVQLDFYTPLDLSGLCRVPFTFFFLPVANPDPRFRNPIPISEADAGRYITRLWPVPEGNSDLLTF
jgi:hypothetical protein